MKNILTTFLLILTLSISAQQLPEVIFNNLEDGAILVRLKTNSNTIKALKGNNDELMERVIKERDQQNREIIHAFEKGFTFCKVYYFYSDNSKTIASGVFDNLLDKDLNKTSPHKPLNNNYLIAEFSHIQQNSDTTKTWSHSEWGVKDGKAQKIDYYSGGNENGPNALIFLMPDFRMVPKGYPNFTRTFEKIPLLERTKTYTVKKMQQKILKYFKYNS